MVFGRKRHNGGEQEGLEAQERDNSGASLHEPPPLTTAYQTFTESTSQLVDRWMPFQQENNNNNTNSKEDPLARPTTTTTTTDANLNTTMDPHTTITTTTSSTTFRGFDTSISDLFVFSKHERTDCCALILCGTLQSDRDRYLMTGVTPPSILKRLLLHLFLPCALFVAAGVSAMRIRDVVVNEMVCVCFLVLLLWYWMLQCHKGTAKRRGIRKDILFTQFQMQQHNRRSRLSFRHNDNTILTVLDHERPMSPNNNNHNNEPDYYLGQTYRDIRCAHPKCLVGCYPEDRPKTYHPRSNNDNVCSYLYEVCCPDFCGVHLQCCGVCGIAQEARTVETQLLPTIVYRPIDYLTMQNMLEWYPSLYQVRHFSTSNHTNTTGGGGGGQNVTTQTTTLATKPPHSCLGQPLSKLGHAILQVCVSTVTVLLVWSVLGQELYYRYVLGRNTPAAHAFGPWEFGMFCVVLLYGMLLVYIARHVLLYNTTTSVPLSLDAILKFLASGFVLSAGLAVFWECFVTMVLDAFFSLVLAAAGIASLDDPETKGTVLWPGTYTLTRISGSPLLLGIGKPEYAQMFGMDHPILYTCYLVIATFVVAAFIEELCKYFGYRMVEHPDFFTQNELEEALTTVGHRDQDDEEDEDEEAAHDEHVASTPPVRDFSLQGKSVQAKGAAITLAMVTVAIGFAVAENFMYVFFYGGNSIRLEVSVLLERMLFPVHPILAAIQSVWVVQREVEGEPIQIGRIIKVSVLFHGAFDFSIVFIGFLGKLWGKNLDYISLAVCALIMGASLLYLHNASGLQRRRLAARDEQGSASSRLL